MLSGRLLTAISTEFIARIIPEKSKLSNLTEISSKSLPTDNLRHSDHEKTVVFRYASGLQRFFIFSTAEI